MNALFSARLEKVRRWLERRGAETLLVTHPPNLFYLCGFSGSAGVLAVTPRAATLCTDGRYLTQARQEVRGARVRIFRGGLLNAVGEWLRRQKVRRVAFEASRVSVAGRRQLAGAAGKEVRWRGVENLVENLRAVKDAHELDRMQAAADLGSAVFEEVLPLVRPGVRELDLAAELDYRMRKRGASGPAFETIVASGPRTALPHARPTDRALRKNELVLFDWGAILRHYCCDLTRTVYLGRAPSRVRRWYAAVLEAQGAAQQALSPGATGAQVDRAARGVLKRAGLARYFVHSTGHGLGLEVHEEPRLAQGQRKPIEAGSVVTLEPGVYLEGIGGIRIEDDVAVLPGGTRTLTRATREFLQL